MAKEEFGEKEMNELEEALFEEFLILEKEEGLDISNKTEISNMFYSIIGDHLPHQYIKGITNGNYLTIIDNLYGRFNS